MGTPMRHQPQGLLRVARTPLATALRLSVLPGVNRSYDPASQLLLATTGTAPVAVPGGVAAGFGATQGAGTTDRIVTGLSGPLTTRSYFFRARKNGAGGGSLGRLFDKTNGLTGQFLCVTATNLTYTEYWAGAERSVSIPVPANGEWFDVLVTTAVSGTGRVTLMYLNGVYVAGESITTIGTFNDAATTVLTIGNRASDNARNWDGLIECAHVWDRILPSKEVAAISANRYQNFEAANEDEDELAPAISGGINVDGSYTELADDGASSASVKTSSSTSVTEAADNIPASDVDVNVAVSGEVTEAVDTLAGVSQVQVAATSTFTESADGAVASTTAYITTSATYLEEADSALISAVSTIAVTADATEGPDTSSSVAVVQLYASASLDEQSDAIISAVSDTATITVTAAIVEDADTVISSAQVVLSVLATLTEQNDSASGAASTGISAASAYTEVPDSIENIGGILVKVTATYSEGADSATSGADSPVAMAESAVFEEHDSAQSDVDVLTASSGSITEASDTVQGSVVNAVVAASQWSEQPDEVLANVSQTFTPREASVALVEIADGIYATAIVTNYVPYTPNKGRTIIVRKETRVLTITKETRIVNVL